MKSVSINLSQIEFDATTQCRASINNEAVAEYTELWVEHGDKPGSPFDSDPVLFMDGTRFWIGDGWHRATSAKRAKRTSIPAEVRTGTRQDAIQFALGANRTNGVRRTNADKRRAVEVALHEFPDWSNRTIADASGVSEFLVRDIRKKLEPKPPVAIKTHPAVSAEKPTTSEMKKPESAPKADKQPVAEPPKTAETTTKPAAKRKGKDGKSYSAEKPKTTTSSRPTKSKSKERPCAVAFTREMTSLISRWRRLLRSAADANGGRGACYARGEKVFDELIAVIAELEEGKQ